MEKTRYFIGNWKMNHGVAETKAYFEVFLSKLKDISLQGKIVAIAPPFTSLALARKLTEGSPIKLCAQNACFAGKGAYTGEVSPLMLQELGVGYVILGHSERRHIFGEDDELINRRFLGVYKAGLIPILCVGEKLEEREKGKTFQVVGEQLERGLSGVTTLEPGRLIVAYEPVWAIGTGINATPTQAEEVHAFLRDRLSGLYNVEISRATPIIYGGSVTPENISELISMPNVDGVLVGGASLDPEKFLRIVGVKAASSTDAEGCALPDYSNLPQDVLEIPKRHKHLVIVGASPKKDRPSYLVTDYLLKRGFEIVPVNPAHHEVLGLKTVRDLSEVPTDFRPEVIIIFRKSSEVLPIVEKALALKPKVIWLQEGIVNEVAKELAEKAGIKFVMNLCFKKVHQLGEAS